jgi:transcriptional regulator with XRE-family HTH domain
MPRVRRVVDPGFAELLAHLRRQRGLTFEALSARVHYSRGYLADLTSGRTRPTPDVAGRLDDALGAGGALAALVTVPQSPPTIFEPPPDDEELAEIERRRSWLTLTRIDDAELRYLESTVARAIVDIERLPPRALVTPLRDLRAQVQELLVVAQHPRTRSRLYTIAAHLSGILASVALDLGRHPVARAYAAEAFELADADQSTEVASWARATQSLIEYYAGRYHDALDFAHDGQRLARSGVATHAVRLVVNGEARALARIGDRYGVDRAVERGLRELENATTRVGPAGDPGTGEAPRPSAGTVSPSLSLASYCRARTVANAGTAYLSLGATHKAIEFGQLALVAFDASGLTGPRALSRLDLATAMITGGVRGRGPDVEQASLLVLEALAVPDATHFASVNVRIGEFLTAAAAWQRDPAIRLVVDRVGATVDRC